MKKTIALLIAAVMVLTCATLLAACNNNDLESAALTEGVTLGPAVEGQDLDLSGKTITVTYKNGETKDVPLTAEMIAGFDKNTLGEQELTITYSEDGKSVSFTTKVTVIKAAPTSLELTASPEVTDYAAGEKFRPDGMVLTARFADGTSTTDIMPEYPDEALSADTDAVTVKYGALSVEVPVTVTAPAYTASDSASLAEALSAAEDGDYILVSGTLGADDREGGYSIYNVKTAARIVGADGATIYGSFVVDSDGVVIRGLTVKNKGWVTGEDSTAHRNAITVTSNKVTIEHNTLMAPGDETIEGAAAIANGIVLSAGTDTATDINIRRNTVTGYGYQNEDWSSAAILFIAGHSFPYGTTNNAGSALSVRVTPDYRELIGSNTMENVEFEFIYSDYALGLERPYIYGYASDAEKAKGILEYAAETGMTLVLKEGEYDLDGISVDKINFVAFDGEAVVRNVTAGENCTFDNVTVE